MAPGPIASLVVDTGNKMQLSIRKDCDTSTAIRRGLAQYLAQMSIVDPGGAIVKFKKVFESWADPEKLTEYPAVAVRAPQAGVFGESKFSQTVSYVDEVPDDDNKPMRRYITSPSELEQMLLLDVWVTEPGMRVQVASMLEAGLNPVDHQYGFLLNLPFYFNQRASYALESITFVDDEESAMRKYRKLAVAVRASLPVTLIISKPTMQVRVDLDAVGPDVLVTS